MRIILTIFIAHYLCGSLMPSVANKIAANVSEVILFLKLVLQLFQAHKYLRSEGLKDSVITRLTIITKQ